MGLHMSRNVYFVGAGSGAVDLITVRGARLLAEADLVIWAGSLVNPGLLGLCKPACRIEDSAKMTLEEVLGAMGQAHAQGQLVVRLHTGDPSLYGAIREQMDGLAKAGIPYEVVPGVSSFSGAAATLKAELTVPGVSQTVVLTRLEGRTPMPQGEGMRELAAHGSTMVIFLSAGMLDALQAELLAAGRESDEPAAIVYKATWPDEQVHRCTVGTLAECGRRAGVRLASLVVVGQVLGGAFERSLLYHPGFSTLYREGDGTLGASSLNVQTE